MSSLPVVESKSEPPFDLAGLEKALKCSVRG